MYRATIISALFLIGCFDVTHPDVYRCGGNYTDCPDGKECIAGICQFRDSQAVNEDARQEDGPLADAKKPADDKALDKEVATDGTVDKTTPPIDQKVPPTDQKVPPTDQKVPPTDQKVPPQDQNVHPQDQKMPPPDQGVVKLDAGPVNLAKGRVAYWNFNEGSALKAKEKGGGQDAILTSSDLWGPGTSGTGLDFSGKKEAAKISDPKGALDNYKNMAISFWYSPSRDITVKDKMVLLQLGKSYHCGLNTGAVVSYPRITCTVKMKGSSITVDLSTAFSPKAHQWYLITLVINGSTGAVTLYINGVHAKGTTGFNGWVNDSYKVDLLIGSGTASGSTALPARGRFDDLMVWSRPLTQADLNELLKTTRPQACVTPTVAADCSFNPTSGEFCTIPAGCYHMGSSRSEPCRQPASSLKESLHPVVLSRTFQIASTEVTNERYKQVTGSTAPSFHINKCTTNCPVEHVTWYQAAAYCNALSTKRKLPVCYTCISGNCSPHPSYKGDMSKCPGFRLPTEAEWEYAARAGTATSTYKGDVSWCTSQDSAADAVAWYKTNKTTQTNEVGKTPANAWGLKDTAGNVVEWTHDSAKTDLSYSEATDPSYYAPNVSTIVRGGHYNSFATAIRAPVRLVQPPKTPSAQVGFRCVRSLPDGLKPISSTGAAYAYDVAADAKGNIYVAGNASGTLTLGTLTLGAGTGTAALVASFTKAGIVRWARAFITTKGKARATALTVDKAGDVWVAGNFEGSMDIKIGSKYVTLDGSSSAAAGGVFVVKLSGTTGNALLTADDSGETGDEVVNDITTGMIGTEEWVYLVGEFSDPTYLGSTKLTPSSYSQDMFVARIKAASGGWSNALKYGSSGFDTARGVAADNSGNVYVTGYFKKQVTFGGKKLTPMLTNGKDLHADMFLLKLNSNFVVQWVVKGGGDLADSGWSVALDKKTNPSMVLVGGVFHGKTPTFGATKVSQGTGTEGFVASYMLTSGMNSWVTPIRSKGNDQVRDVLMDKEQNIQFMGIAGGSVSVKSWTVTGFGKGDFLVGMLDFGGKLVWAKLGGSKGDDLGRRMTIDSQGQTHVVGDFNQAVQFGGHKYTPKGLRDGAVWSWTAP